MIDFNIGDSETIATGEGVAKNGKGGNIIRFVKGEGLKTTRVEGYIAGKAHGGALEVRTLHGLRILGSGLEHDTAINTNLSVGFIHNSFQVGQKLPITLGKGVTFTTNGTVNPFLKDSALGEGSSSNVLASLGGSAGITWRTTDATYITDFASDAVASAQNQGKTAVVKGDEEGNYVSLYCLESPEVRFQDIITLQPKGLSTIEHEIEATFLYVCESDSIKVVGHIASDPVECKITIENNKIIIIFEEEIPEEITIEISGIRKGNKDVRFTPHNKEQMLKNEEFWSIPHK